MPHIVATLDPRRRKILWRATHRGIREMDILLGGFAQARVAELTDDELGELEAIVELPDQEMLTWATGQVAVPVKHRSGLLAEMLRHRPT